MTETCSTRETGASGQTGAPGAAEPHAVPCHDARALTRGGAQAQITLEGQVYTLRITRAGKLILTK
jgi:hemin uptake protein HemP